jgi:hypothetical protein
MTPSFNADLKQAAHIEGGPLAALLKAIPGATQWLAPDQHLTMEGSHRRSVIGVISGTLRSFRMTPDGRRHITRFVDPGGLIGLGALNAFRTSTEAVTVSRIVSFKASALEAVMARDAGVISSLCAAVRSPPWPKETASTPHTMGARARWRLRDEQHNPRRAREDKACLRSAGESRWRTHPR